MAGRVSNSLVALSSAAVLAVYSAGYIRTKSTADRLAVLAAERRPARPSAPPIARVVPSAPAATAIAPPTAANAPAPASTPEPAVTAQVPVSGAASTRVTESVPSPAPTPAAAQSSQPAAITAQVPAPSVVPAVPVYKDGTYYAWGATSIHGDLQAVVVIEGGKITYAEFEKCHTRYSCNVIGNLPSQVVVRQSAEVDQVSGATESADAFRFAVMEALSQAQ